MTAYLTFQAIKAGTIKPDDKLICSKEAAAQAPSKLWLPVGGDSPSTSDSRFSSSNPPTTWRS